MKTHINLHTSDLRRSVEFYRVLLAAEPAKRHDDYALFLLDDPPLELALDAGGQAAPEQAHYGIVVAGEAGVDAAAGRLIRAGQRATIERRETCCYAKQTKVWTSDPDGRAWEVYTVLEETEDRGSDCCARGSAEEACCA